MKLQSLDSWFHLKRGRLCFEIMPNVHMYDNCVSSAAVLLWMKVVRSCAEPYFLLPASMKFAGQTRSCECQLHRLETP